MGRLVPLLAVIVAVALSASSSAQASRAGATSVRNAMATSTNWAGYAVTTVDPEATPPSPTDPTPPATPPTFTSVSGRWVQPAVTCTKPRATFSAFWVGIGGFSPTSQALEQVGTTADCTTAGKARYSMWYELVPAPSVTIKFKVFPGNAIAASVKVNGTRVTLQIRNLTRRTNFTKTFTVAAPDTSSAEWIAEAPSGCNAAGQCRQLPLARFRTVTFTQASATTSDGHAGTISDPTWFPTTINLEDVASGAFPGQTPISGALPSPLTTTGASFAVAYQQALSQQGSARGR
jgi:peptidase A4-like protein